MRVQHLARVAAVDGDFQASRRSGQRTGGSWHHIGIGAYQPVDAAAADPDGHGRCPSPPFEAGASQIRHEIPEPVDGDHLTPEPRRALPDLGQVGGDDIANARSQRSRAAPRWPAWRRPARNGRGPRRSVPPHASRSEDRISTTRCGGDWSQARPNRPLSGPTNRRPPRRRPARDGCVPTPGSTTARITVPGGQVAPARLDEQRAGDDISGGHLVGDVDQRGRVGRGRAPPPSSTRRSGLGRRSR